MTTRSLATGFALWMTASAALAQGEPLTIQNPALAAAFDPASGRFSLTAKPSRRPFMKDGTLTATGGVARIVTVMDTTFGQGQAIEVTSAGDQRDTLVLFPNLPFALFRSTRRNGGAEATVVKSVRTFSGAVDLGQPPAELKTLGTGGLLAPDQNPGSYVWLAVAEPRSRHGVVCGWLTSERGSGIIFSRVTNGEVAVDARIDYGRLRLSSGRAAELETFAVGYFADARLGLEAWADAVARVDRIQIRPQPAGYCTWYSKPHGGASDEKHLAELSAFAAKQLAPFGFSVVQIDDHWQAGVSTNGPKRNFTTHAPDGPYPSGMKAIADQIKADGLVPGIWFMPFAGTYYDPFFKDHPDWFVKRADGQPYETDWGGTCLDMTEAGAREYLRQNVRRLAHEWGFQYFKMDGLWTGTGTRQQYVNSGYKDDGLGDAVFRNPDATGIAAFRSGLKLVREAAGPDVFFLGCCAPQNMRSYGAAFGLVDAMRIGPDNGADWKGLLRGPTWGSRHYFLHGRVWYNDPDPVYARADVPLRHAQVICSWVALSGQLNLSSEWLPGLPPERLDLLKRTLPSHGLRPRPADLFEEPLPRLWLLTDERRSPRRDVVGLFNWGEQEQAFDYSLERLGLAGDAEYVAFDYWQNALVPPMKGRLKITVPAQSCRILAVRPRSDHPQLLSTSRHITQGIVDVVEETWRPTDRALQGRSRVVAGDPYELRIALPDAGTRWTVDAAGILPQDLTAGVTAAIAEKDGLVRVTLTSPVSREVGWSVRFKTR